MGEVETKVTGMPKKKVRLPLFIAAGAVVIAAVVAAVALLGNGGSDDDWLRKALAEDSVRTIELNEDIKATEGYEVNGTKTIVGSGKISMTESSNYVFSVNSGASLTVEGITLNVKNIGNNGAVVRSGGKLEWKSGTISYPKQYAIINYGEANIAGGTFEYAGTSWLYLKADTKASITGGYFVKSGGVGFEVEKGATLNISGKDTLMERAGSNTINNNGTVIMTGGTIAQSEVWTITNHGALTMKNVTVKDCALKGVLYNYADGVSADISNCTFTNSKTYHIYNQKGATVSIKDTVMKDSGASSLNNQIGSTMNLENVSLTNCGYHGIYNDRGTINIKNCSVDTTVYKGVQNKSGFVTIDGLKLDNVGGSALGNVAYVEGAEYGYIHASNVTITNTKEYNVVSYGGTMTLSNSTLNVTPGCNVYIRNGKYELNNVQVLGTTTAGKAAVVFGSDTYRTVEGSIKGDTVITGAASRGVTNYGTLYIYDGSIYGNRPSGTSKAGGGLYTLGDVYMYGGTIRNNSAVTYGGGIRVDADEKTTGNLYMYGGSVINNKADSNGGGISIAKAECGLYLYGGTVSGNVSGGKGNGILSNGTFELGGDAVIKNNDVYLFENGRVIDVKATSFSGEPLVIRHGGLSEGAVIARFPTEATANALQSHFVSGNEQFKFVVEGNKLVATISMADLTSPVDFTGAPETTVTTFAQLKSAVESTTDKKIIKIAADIPMTGVITVPASASVKLIDDGTARVLTRSGFKSELFYLNNAANLYVAGNAGLTMDGASATIQAEKPLIFATSNAYVVLEKGAVLQNNINTSYATSACGGAVNLYGGRMILDGGVITGCAAPTYEKEGASMTNRPAVYVSTSAVLSIKDGEISKNLNGAIRSYGRVYISGGEIKDNIRSGDGGAGIRACWVYMTGGTISGNETTNAGSGVYITPSESYPEGYFYMNGGTITGNASGVNAADPNYVFDTVGGAVYIAEKCTFDFVSGTISNNQAIGNKTGSNIGMNGGAIVNDGTTYLRSGAVVKDNYAARNAGGIYCRNKGAILTIEGATISGNTTDGRGGAIFTEGDKNVVTITGATIENNKAVGAGGILFGGGKHTVTDTVFKGNVAERVADTYGNAGAIMNQSETELTLTNVTFEGNKAIAKDGGGGCGGAIYNSKATLITNGIVAKNNEARVADDIFFSVDTLDTTVNGAFDVTEIYLEGAVELGIGENFSGRTGGEKILVDLPTGSSTNRYVSGNRILGGKVDATSAAAFTLGSNYAQWLISDKGVIYAQGENPDDFQPVEPTETVVAKIGDVEYTSLKDAVAAAKDGDTVVIVADIQQKTKMTINKAITITTDGNADRTITSGVTSGFMIALEADVTISGTEASKLILDGAQKGSSLLQVASGANASVSYVTLQNAKSGEQGGAVQLKSGSGKVTFTNCVLQNNETTKSGKTTHAGGAMFVGGGREAEMIDCQILNNKAAGCGGAFTLSTSSGKTGKLTLTNCTVSGNETTGGLGAVVYGTQTSGVPTEFHATNTTFAGNKCSLTIPDGDAYYINGVVRMTGAYYLDKCLFQNNDGYAVADNSEKDFGEKNSKVTNTEFDKSKAEAIYQNVASKADIDKDGNENGNIYGVAKVAQVGETKYETLQAAMSDALANASEATVILLTNVTENVDVAAGKTVTITGSKIITGNATVSGTLNLADTQLRGNAAVSGTLGLAGTALVTDGKVTLDTNGVIAVSGTLSAETTATVAPATEGKVILTGDVAANVGKFKLDTTDATLYIDEATGKVAKLAYAALVNGQPYGSLTEAVAAANAGDTITLAVGDMTGITFDKNVTLTAAEALELSGVANVNAGVTVTIDANITGGEFKAEDDTASVTGGAYGKFTESDGDIYYIKLVAGATVVNETTRASYTTLSAAVSAVQNGETLVLTGSTYDLTGTLKIDKNITIATDGNGTKTIQANHTNEYGVTVEGTSYSAFANVKILGTENSPIIIDGMNKSRSKEVVHTKYAALQMDYVTICNGNSSSRGGALLVEYAKATADSAVVLNNCTITGNKNGSNSHGTAVHIAATGRVKMNNCSVTNNTHTGNLSIVQIAQGSSGGNPGQLFAADCTFANNTIMVKAAANSVIRSNGGFILTGCTFSNNVGANAESDPAAWDIYVITEGNTYANTGYEREVTNCVFDTAENVAIGGQSDTLYCERVTLRGNLYNAGRTGSKAILDTLPTMVSGATLMGYTDGSNGAEEVTYRFADAAAVNAAYTAYTAALETDGYTKYTDNTIGENLFATYTKGNVSVTVMATPGSRTLRLIAEEDAVKFSTATVEVGSVEPSITMLGVGDAQHKNASDEFDQRNGMSFVYQISDGSFVIVDGGYDAADAQRIYDLLQEKKTGTKPVISAWILTHSHVDHAAAFCAFVGDSAKMSAVELQSVVVNLAGAASYAEAGGGIQSTVATALANLPAGTTVYKPHPGDVMQLAGTTIEFLYTYEMAAPSALWNLNDSSLVFTVEIAGQKILMTGDAAAATAEVMLANYGAAVLGSDVLQVAHHGFHNHIVPKAFYQAVVGDATIEAPKLALWPSCDERSMANHANNAAAAANQYLAELQTAGKLSIVVAGDRTADAITYAIKSTGLELEEVLPPNVAEVGGTQYPTVAAAIAAAADGGEVKLLANAADVAVDKNLTLTADTDVTVTNITVADGKALDLDGKVTAANITLGSGATIVLDDDDAPESNVTVTGGAVGTTIATGDKVVANYDKLNVTNDGLMGYPVEVAGETVIQLVTKGEAKIGDTTYATLEAAVEAAEASDTASTITLIADTKIAATLTLNKGETITTDGWKDRTITAAEAVIENMFKVTAGGVTLQGASASSKLVIDGEKIARKSAIHVESAAASDELTMQYVAIQNMKSASVNGGAIHVKLGTLDADNCSFIRNEVTGEGSSGTSGGAIFADGTSVLEINNCVFNGNKTAYRGGAIYVNTSATLAVADCTFNQNEAGNSGGAIVFVGDVERTLTRCIFTNNISGNFGGAIGCSGAKSTVVLVGDCNFTGNVAKGTGSFAGGAISVGKALKVNSGVVVITQNNAENGYGGAIGMQQYKSSGVTPVIEVGNGAYLYIYGNTQKNSSGHADSENQISFNKQTDRFTITGNVIYTAPVTP